MNTSTLSIVSFPLVLKGSVQLPASKSLSNRALIIQALSPEPFTIENLSDADDTRLMAAALRAEYREVYVENAGTAMRFLTAYYAAKGMEVILDGSPAMRKRPIGELVNALNTLGAAISHVDKEGYPPLHIGKRQLRGGYVSIPADISSQFITALLLVAPILENGLELELVGDISSADYIDMTLEMMRYFGVEAKEGGRVIHIARQSYSPKPITIENDWSSAGYFYALAAILNGSEIELPGLLKGSLQGDSRIADLAAEFGVETDFHPDSVTIRSATATDKLNYFQADMLSQPDLIPTLVCICCALDIPFRITGTKTLIYKETNRSRALETELRKLGYILDVEADSLEWKGKTVPEEAQPLLKTYDDHRLAMCWAVMALKHRSLQIEKPVVVTKSFPAFWKALADLGIETHFEL